MSEHNVQRSVAPAKCNYPVKKADPETGVNGEEMEKSRKDSSGKGSMWEHAHHAPTMDDAPGLVDASEERELQRSDEMFRTYMREMLNIGATLVPRKNQERGRFQIPEKECGLLSDYPHGRMTEFVGTVRFFYNV
jgi:hypothetical protein